MDNKEVLDKLQKYFLDQCDPKVVARSLASCMIDFNRLHYYDNLSESQAKNLNYRIYEMVKELHKFIKDGPDGELKIKIVNPEE